ncbi:hypothetical protein DIJ64_08725 [Mycobacterium leprae]|uniref:Uncharacterized protein n=1 Tax=Mycobacterium leprae TaxID=1769 RepID=A0AAD0P8A5_MYCLR|nr:hypothetical protein DIJ64_08725 [Mycobacterium leprae]OAR21615.1 hypothetical protein A8144_04990 [Mycobacterium leprae 3125609]
MNEVHDYSYLTKAAIKLAAGAARIAAFGGFTTVATAEIIVTRSFDASETLVDGPLVTIFYRQQPTASNVISPWLTRCKDSFGRTT